MSRSSYLQAGQPAVRRTPVAAQRQNEPAAQLANGLLEELYRRRDALAFALIMALLLLAAAVGLRVWAEQQQLGVAPGNPAVTASNSSSDLQGGPTGTWQRWGDLGSEKRSQRSIAASPVSSTTTFPASDAAAATRP